MLERTLRKLAISFWGKKGQVHTGLCLQLYRRQVERSGHSLLFGTKEITSGLLCPGFCLPSINKLKVLNHSQWRELEYVIESLFVLKRAANDLQVVFSVAAKVVTEVFGSI